jgi:metal-sulfur cluster biosynthetic enzyme
MSSITLSPGNLLDSLTQVIDPEVGINIVDLGLVYAVHLTGTEATIEMTLTTPGCPLHASIEAAVKRALSNNHPELTSVTVQIVWDPRWNVDFITEEGRRQLGW